MSLSSITARLFPAGTFVLRFVPRGAAIGLAYAVGEVFSVVSVARRRAVDRNLQRTAAGATASERRQLRRATFRNFAANWVDFLNAPNLTRLALLDLVRWDTREKLDAALSLGHGVVVITAHVGALDLAGIYLAACGYPISVVVEDLDPTMFRVWSKYRALTGLRVLSRRHGAVRAYRALRRGEIVVVVADRVIAGTSLEVNFCGDRRRVPLGPAAFARRTGAPLMVLHMTRRADGSGYDLVAGPPIGPSGTTEDIARLIAGELESIVRRFPDQWFDFEAAWCGESAETSSNALVQWPDRHAP